MKIENLKKGMILKSYKELCSILETPIKSSNSKKAQLNELERYCKFHNDGNKFIIDKIYSIPKPKIDGRGKSKGSHGNNRKDFHQYKIKRKYDESRGIYIFIKDKYVYIGSTYVGFRNRFRGHLNQEKYRPENIIEGSKYILDNGGAMYLLHNLDEINDEPLIRMIEEEYIEYFRNETDYNVLNEMSPTKLIKKDKIEERKTRAIKVLSEDYELALQILKENNIKTLGWGETL